MYRGYLNCGMKQRNGKTRGGWERSCLGAKARKGIKTAVVSFVSFVTAATRGGSRHHMMSSLRNLVIIRKTWELTSPAVFCSGGIDDLYNVSVGSDRELTGGGDSLSRIPTASAGDILVEVDWMIR